MTKNTWWLTPRTKKQGQLITAGVFRECGAYSFTVQTNPPAKYVRETSSGYTSRVECVRGARAAVKRIMAIIEGAA